MQAFDCYRLLSQFHVGGGRGGGGGGGGRGGPFLINYIIYKTHTDHCYRVIFGIIVGYLQSTRGHMMSIQEGEVVEWLLRKAKERKRERERERAPGHNRRERGRNMCGRECSKCHDLSTLSSVQRG